MTDKILKQNKELSFLILSYFPQILESKFKVEHKNKVKEK